MCFLDHPLPQFQAVYGEHECSVATATGEVIDRPVPWTAVRLVKQWTLAHQAELQAVLVPDDSIDEYGISAIVSEAGPMVEPLRDLDYVKLGCAGLASVQGTCRSSRTHDLLRPIADNITRLVSYEHRGRLHW